MNAAEQREQWQGHGCSFVIVAFDCYVHTCTVDAYPRRKAGRRECACTCNMRVSVCFETCPISAASLRTLSVCTGTCSTSRALLLFLLLSTPQPLTCSHFPFLALCCIRLYINPLAPSFYSQPTYLLYLPLLSLPTLPVSMTETVLFPPLSPPSLSPPLTSPPPSAANAPAASSSITAEAIIRAALAANAAAAPGAHPPIDITALLTSLAALPSAAPATAPAPMDVATSAPSPLATTPAVTPLPSVASYPPPPPAAAAEDPSLLNDWQAFLQQRAATKQQQQQQQLAYTVDTDHTASSPPSPTSAPTPTKRQKRLYPVHNCGVCLLPCLPFPSARRHCTCCACGVSVHIECYGISKMSKAHSRALRRRWKCERCKDDETRIEVEGMVASGGDGGDGGEGTGEAGTDTECMYCPSSRFALKKASNGRYVHVVCALFLPSLAFTLHHLLPFTATTMEERSKKKHRSFLLVTGVNDIPEQQYELACNICTSPTGLCVQCADEACTVSYHVTCAMEAGYCVRVEEEAIDAADDVEAGGGDGVILRSWCAAHRPADWDAESEERGVRWVMEGKRLRRAEQGDELEERDGDWEDVDGMEEEDGGEEVVKEEAE